MDITTSLLKDWSERAKSAYLTKGVEPSTTVRSIMEENDLNRKQTQRLCEATNLEIKAALRNSQGPDDVQFPLVSINDVMSGPDDGEEMAEKTASLMPGSSFFEDYVRGYFSVREMKKEASVVLDSEKLAMVVESLKVRTDDAHREVTIKMREFEKVAQNILEYLTDEARATGSVDESYTVVSSNMQKRAELIDRFYKYADRVLDVDLHGMTIKKAGIITTPGRIPNNDCEIVNLFRKYASAFDEVGDARTRYAGINNATKDAESRLRRMILNGE